MAWSVEGREANGLRSHSSSEKTTVALLITIVLMTAAFYAASMSSLWPSRFRAVLLNRLGGREEEEESGCLL